jgi:hypothetical protein
VSNFKLYKTRFFRVNIEIIQFLVGVIRLVFKGKYKVMKAELTWSLNICSFVALEGRASRSFNFYTPFLSSFFFVELKHGG